MQTEARSAKNAPESAICGVLRKRLAPTGSVLWLAPISSPRKPASHGRWTNLRSADEWRFFLVSRPFNQRILFYELAGGDLVLRRARRGQRDLPRRLLEAPGAELAPPASPTRMRFTSPPHPNGPSYAGTTPLPTKQNEPARSPGRTASCRNMTFSWTPFQGRGRSGLRLLLDLAIFLFLAPLFQNAPGFRFPPSGFSFQPFSLSAFYFVASRATCAGSATRGRSFQSGAERNAVKS